MTKRSRVINITLISLCQIDLMVLDGLKEYFVYIYYTNQFNPKTEDSTSNKELEHSLDTYLIL